MCSLAIHNVRVATPSGDRYILRDITGVARPYELHALLGPSGAGKSTLMDILAVRKAIGSYTGALQARAFLVVLTPLRKPGRIRGWCLHLFHL